MTERESMGESTARFDAPFVAKQDDKRFVLGPVLIPEVPDQQKDVVTEENIRDVAHKFLTDYQNVDLMHTFENVALPAESYVAPTDLTFGDTTVPKGSWMLGVRVEDDETWRRVKSGDLQGFSIYGQGERKPVESADVSLDPEKVAKSASVMPGVDPETAKERAEKDPKLLDLTRVTFVSLVDDPAVGDSEYLVMKRSGAAPPSHLKAADDAASWESIDPTDESGDSVEGRLGKAGRTLSNDSVSELAGILSAADSGHITQVRRRLRRFLRDRAESEQLAPFDVDLSSTLDDPQTSEIENMDEEEMDQLAERIGEAVKGEQDDDRDFVTHDELDERLEKTREDITDDVTTEIESVKDMLEGDEEGGGGDEETEKSGDGDGDGDGDDVPSDLEKRIENLERENERLRDATGVETRKGNVGSPGNGEGGEGDGPETVAEKAQSQTRDDGTLGMTERLTNSGGD